MKPETVATLKVIAMGCVIIFLVFLGLSVPFFLRQRTILKTWPRAEGTIEAAQVVTVPGKTSTYAARFLIRYHIGNSVVSTTVDSGYGDRFRRQAEAWVERFPVGTTVPIAYDPLNPTLVRLAPGYNRYFFGAPFFITEVGLVFAGVALVLYAFARWSERATRNSTVSTNR